MIKKHGKKFNIKKHTYLIKSFGLSAWILKKQKVIIIKARY